MAEKKVIAVVGATGSQGGGLARAILADAGGGFAVRALTRNPDSDTARELAALGAEVVKADLGDLRSLTEAFDGAHGAFLVTNFWADMSPEREKQEAATMARAAKAAGVAHVIWSTLEDTRDYIPLDDERMPTLMGGYKVPHFDAKAEANQFFTDAGVPTTFLQTTFYWENLLGPMAPRRGDDGRLVLAMPMADSLLAGIAVEDIGKTAYGIFRRGGDLIGRTVSIAGEHLTGKQMAEQLSVALGEDVAYVPVPFDVMRAQPFPAAAESGNMFQFYAEVPQFNAVRDLDVVRSLNPQLQTFEQWLNAHKPAFAAA
ncbi:NmrA/HSCARG family protein [Streptomyces cahuitamycinicus]|uniref:Nucleoside-diphosphate sugar epimerase n=1 Tax=Streptomyces cahuitamycinicus TaxID=2070367 RepID=A0A2N8TL64_9ACTN|nr:NmrA/HSCARG family protein [Streptomyces cahuitamycinicus]PNG19752.1 nucleoside-diphosphate sugar epimerase [Streptomyces cahuitamycinicus]